MDRLKLAALGERLKTGGERLKTGGAEMARQVSGKMKEILQVQSQEAKMVDEATSERLEEPNWGLNLRICGLLNSDEFNGSEVMRAIKKKMGSKNAVSQRLCLDLLEACAMNCDKVFSEVASEKVLDEMLRMIDCPETVHGNRRRAVQLIEAWGKSEDLDYLPVFNQTYLSLEARKILLGVSGDGNYSSEPGDVEHAMALPETYSYPGMDQQNTHSDVLAYHEGDLSMEEKNEILVITRNSIEILSSALNSGTQQKSMKDDVMMTILERCKAAQPSIQRIIESVTDDEQLLFEALNIHDELQRVLSMYEEVEVIDPPADGQTLTDSSTPKELKSDPLTDQIEAVAKGQANPVGEGAESHRIEQ